MQFQSWRVALLVGFLSACMGCQSIAVAMARQVSEPSWVEPPDDMEVKRDVVFAETADGNLLLDLYMPKDRSAEALPLVVWVYGGGWFVGNRNQIQLSRAYHLTRRGYAVAAISYRLSSVAPFPAQIHDVKASVRYLRANAVSLGLNTERIGVWGASAGGHLVALMGTTNGDPKMEGTVGGPALAGESSDVAAVANYFGPSDLSTMHLDAGRDEAGFMVERLLGGDFEAKKELAEEASPVAWASPSSAPMLHVHGTEDAVVSIRQSERLHEALTQAGADSTLRVVTDGGHGRGAEFGGEVLIGEVGDFFDRHLRP